MIYSILGIILILFLFIIRIKLLTKEVKNGKVKGEGIIEILLEKQIKQDLHENSSK